MAKEQRLIWPVRLIVMNHSCNNGLAFSFYAFCVHYCITIIIIAFNAGGLWQKVRKRDGMFSFSPIALFRATQAKYQELKCYRTSQRHTQIQTHFYFASIEREIVTALISMPIHYKGLGYKLNVLNGELWFPISFFSLSTAIMYICGGSNSKAFH